VRPDYPSFDLAHVGLADAEHRGNLSLEKSKAADFQDLLGGQLGHGVGFAALSGGSIFPISILAIVGCRAAKQMIGVYARRVIAVMANKHAIWNGAEGVFVNPPMGAKVFALIANSAISILIFHSIPDNASRLMWGAVKTETVNHRPNPWRRVSRFIHSFVCPITHGNVLAFLWRDAVRTAMLPRPNNTTTSQKSNPHRINSWSECYV
jgi:hypothetical protein